MSAGQSATLRILFVPEGRTLFRELSDRFMRFEGVEIEMTPSVSIAVELIKSGRWHAVISGMHLDEGKTGLDFLREIRRFDQIFPLFFFTKDNSPGLISEAFQAGANDYFVADGSSSQLDVILDAVKVSAEIASLLRDKVKGKQRNIFEEKYELLFDELKEGSMIVSAEDGRISYINETLAESIGKKSEEIIDKSLDAHLAKRKGAVVDWIDLLKQAESGSAVTQLSFRHVSGDVRSFWTQARLFEISEKPVILCQCRDVTRLEKLELEIYSVRNQLKVIVENSADAIILARQDGMIEFIGGSAPRMFGISPDDMNVTSISELFGPQGEAIQRVMRQMGQRPRVSGVESQVVSRWGTNVPVSMAITRLPSSDKVTRFLFNIMDISSQKVMEAEKLMITELVAIMSTGVSAVEALPKLIDRLYNKVPIDYGLVVSVDDQSEKLKVAAVYNKQVSGNIRVGQEMKIEFLPAEEELWMREGIVRNNLQQQGLHPLETLLYKEGVRSYLSLPLIEHGKLIGGAHFGSSKAYALNRGHLSLFSEIASALTGTILRAQHGDMATRFQQFAATMAETSDNPVIMCDTDGRIFSINKAAGSLLGDDTELSGRMLDIVLRNAFPKLSNHGSLFTDLEDVPRVLRREDGSMWELTMTPVGERNNLHGFVISLKPEQARK